MGDTLAVADELGLRATGMLTITGHDALALAAAMPSTLVFVPSVDGLSHNEAELTLPDDLRNGGAVIEALLRRWISSDSAG